MTWAITSIGACEGTLFGLFTADGVVAFEELLNEQEVVNWDDSIAHSCVHDGILTLQVRQLLVLLRIIQTYMVHVQGPVSLLRKDLAPENVVGLCS
jgi:hypothetical protein